MKITRSQLRQIIKEQATSVIPEQLAQGDAMKLLDEKSKLEQLGIKLGKFNDKKLKAIGSLLAKIGDAIGTIASEEITDLDTEFGKLKTYMDSLEQTYK